MLLLCLLERDRHGARIHNPIRRGPARPEGDQQRRAVDFDRYAHKHPPPTSCSLVGHCIRAHSREPIARRWYGDDGICRLADSNGATPQCVIAAAERQLHRALIATSTHAVQRHSRALIGAEPAAHVPRGRVGCATWTRRRVGAATWARATQAVVEVGTCQVEEAVLRVDDDDARGGRRARRGAYLRPARYRRDPPRC